MSLSSDPLWKEMYFLADYIYSLLDEMADNFPDEKWNTVSKLRSSANDGMFYVAQAIGSSTSDTAEFEWNGARKNLFALRSMYVFAGKQKFLSLEPGIVVRFDKLIVEVEVKIVHAKDEARKRVATDLEPWLEKYRLWQKINK